MTLAGKESRFLQILSDAELEAKLLRVAHPSRAGETGRHVHEHLVRFRYLFDSVGSAAASSALPDVGGTGICCQCTLMI